MTSQSTSPEAPPSTNKTARELLELLGETNATANDILRQMRRLVASQGREFVMEMYRRAVETEAAGGLSYIRNGETQRRTLGGVFFWHVRQALGPEKSAELMPTRRMLIDRDRAARAARRAAEPKAPELVEPSRAVAEIQVTKASPVAAKAPPAPKVRPATKNPPPSPVRTSGKKRGPAKMPEVFYSGRTK